MGFRLNSSHSSRRWLKLFLKTGSAIFLGLFLLVIVGMGVAQWWAKSHLAPMIAKELSKSLKRPVKVGAIADIWLNQIHIRNASIPPNGSDLSRLAVEDIVINFNPLKLALDRTFKFDVRLTAPSIYLSQNVQGKWVNIPAPEQTPPSPIKVEVGTVEIDDAKIIVVPYSKNPQPITVSKINLQADVNAPQDRVSFHGGARFGTSGQLQLQGNSLIASGETQLAVKGQKLDAAAATRIVKIPEVEIAHGSVDGDLNLAIKPQKYLRISSNLLVHDGKILINHVPRSLDEVNGFIQVSERDVKFNHVTTKYDRVAGVVNGDLNYYTGYQLRARTAPITLPDIFKSIDVKSPFPLAGAAIGELQLTGKLNRPILVGKFNHSQPSQVDRVQIDRFNGNFRLADGRIKLVATAQPKLGGKVTTQGEIQLLKTPKTHFQLQGHHLPGDSLSRLYGAKLPPQLKIGNAVIQGTIEGNGADIYTNLHVNAPQATHPIAMDLRITPQGKTIVRGVNLAVAEGNVSGTGEITATNWRLNLQSQGLNIQKLAKIGGMNLTANYGGKLAGNLQIAGLNHQLDVDRFQAQGRLNLQLAAGQLIVDQINVDRGNWRANISSNALDLQQLKADDNIDIDPVLRFQKSTIDKSNESDRANYQLPVGVISGSFHLSGNSLKKISPASILAQGHGKIKLKAGEIQSENLTINNGDWQGIFTTKDLQLAEFNSHINGHLNGKFNLAGNLRKFTTESIRGVGGGILNLPQGKIIGNNLQIDRGKWQGNFQSSSLVLDGLAPGLPLKFKNAKLAANLQVAGDIQQLKPENITVSGNGKLSLAGGNIIARQLEIRSGKWRGNFGLDRLKLGDFSADIPAGFESTQLSGNYIATGDIAKLNPARVKVFGDGELNLGDSKIRATGFKLDGGNWSSNLAIVNLKLGDINKQLFPQLPASQITGNFNVAGNVNKLIPTAIQVNGNGKINRILGGAIQIDHLTVNNGKWQSNLIIDRLNIGELAKFAPPNISSVGRLTGQLSANWQLGGNLQHNSLDNIQVLGQTKLTNFQIGALKFDPNLMGNIQANPGQGVEIAVAGKIATPEEKSPHRLAISLNRNLQLQRFEIHQPQLIATGNVDRHILDINVERLPIALLQPWIPQSVGIQAYRFDGIATGNLAVNLANFQVTGKQIEITNPTFGAFEGDRLLTNFRYANGQLNLNQTEIQRGAHTYFLDTTIAAGATTPTFQAKLQVPSGTVEDIRNLLQIFSFSDLFTPFNRRQYGTAADLHAQTEKIANRLQPLYNEMRRLSELRRWLNREANRQEENKIIPDIGNLQGDFSGEISIANQPQTGFSSDFNIVGANWQFLGGASSQQNRYHLDRIQATGNWHNGKLHFAPLSMKIDGSQIGIVGDFSANNQNAQVNIQNFPAEWFSGLIELPVDIHGEISLAAQISGNSGNPHASGQISVSNGRMNSTKLQDATGIFNYWDGRLNFASEATFADRPIVAQADRIKITGSIPYQLPFSLKPPVSQDIKIELSLQNQGLQILDVFSKQQLHWIDGQGKIALKIDGKMKASGGEIERLSASGTAQITKGRIQTQAIPEPLTDVNGDIIFDFDRIDVQKLTGKLHQGQVVVAGILPISDSFSIDPSQQLNIQMNGIAVDLQDKYSGDVNGKLTILGTALNPILTGDIQLSNGQILIPDSPNTTTTVLGIQPALPAAPNPNSLQLRNLHLTLGNNLQITRAPLLNFFATGKLDIDGTLDNLRPFGQVQLQKGSVNLFTTQFRLASGPQTADFFPTLGTEPVLNLRLYAKILESNTNPLSQRNSIARTTENGEIDRPAEFYTTSLGSVQTIQVEARIAGLASQLTQKLELTSTPSRSQPEIVLLLGGALVERLGSGDNIGLGVVSLASSTLFNSIEDRISDFFRLSDFRLFPTILKDSKTSSNSTLGIAAEVGTDITPKVSTSVFKILTNSESPYYSLRYRVNDQILLRGSSNFYGENRAIVEFEQRF